MSARLSTVFHGLLGRHIRSRAENDALLRGRIAQRRRVRQIQLRLLSGKCLRQSEIQHLHLAIGSDFDICGLEVPVDDAFFMRGFESFSNLQG